MTFPKSEHLVPPMTVEAAADYAVKLRRFVEHDAEVSGLPADDALDFAFDRFERTYGIGRWTLEHLRKGRAKGCDIGIFARMKAAYVDLCERQVTKLQHEIAIEKAAAGDDFDVDLDREVRELVAKVAAKKAALKLSRATPKPSQEIE